MVKKSGTKPVFELASKTVDLSKALPLTLGDFKILAEEGLDAMQMGDNMDVPSLVKLITYLCKKANPEITDEDVLTMPTTWLQRLTAIAIGVEDNPPF